MITTRDVLCGVCCICFYSRISARGCLSSGPLRKLGGGGGGGGVLSVFGPIRKAGVLLISGPIQVRIQNVLEEGAEKLARAIFDNTPILETEDGGGGCPSPLSPPPLNTPLYVIQQSRGVQGADLYDKQLRQSCVARMTSLYN